MTTKRVNHQRILLGTGGATPGVEVFSSDHGQPVRIVDLPSGHSAYAMHASSGGGVLYVGTRSGNTVRLLEGDGSAAALFVQTPELCLDGCVIAITEICRDVVVVAAADGSLHIWNPEMGTSRQLGSPGNSPICGVLRLWDEEFTCLDAEGRLFRWSVSDGAPALLAHGPVPPEWSSFVSTVYWPDAELIVWPSVEGQLCTFNLASDCFRVVPAHIGPFSAITVMGSTLVTIGHDDGRLHCWRPDLTGPSQSFDAPSDVVAVACPAPRSPTLFMIDHHGNAQLHAVEAHRLEHVGGFPGRAYRSLHVSDGDAIHGLNHHVRTIRATRITQQLLQCSPDGHGSDTYDLHQRLERLGHHRTVLMIHAERDRHNPNQVERLRALHECAHTAGDSVFDPVQGVIAYAECLERMCLYEPALHAWTQLAAATDICPAVETSIRRLNDRVAAINTGRYIIEAGADLKQIVEASAILDRPFTGRWLAHVYRAWSCPCPIDARAVAAQHAECVGEPGSTVHTVSRYEQWQRLHASGMEPIEAVMVPLACDPEIVSLECGVAFKPTTGAAIIVPIMAVNVATPADPGSGQTQNQGVLEILNTSLSSPLMSAWSTAVLCTLRRAVRRIMTRCLHEVRHG